MRFVLILEDEEKFKKEVCEALMDIDPKLQIRVFTSAREFAAWIKLVMEKGPESLKSAGQTPEGITQQVLNEEEHVVSLIISKVEFFGKEQMSLLKKTQKLFLERKLSKPEDPCSFVLTKFEEAVENIKSLKEPILSNVIYKPFDRLILKQHLTSAVDGRHKPSKFFIANQKTTSVIEMVKEVPMLSLSEVGFTTQSDRAITLGTVAKYYGPDFIAGQLASVVAKVIKCDVDPSDSKKMIVGMQFFALDSEQFKNIRRIVHDKAHKEIPYHWVESKPPKKLNLVVIDDEPDIVQAFLENKFSDFQLVAYPTYTEFLVDLDPKSFQGEEAEKPEKAFSQAEVELEMDITGATINSITKVKDEKITVFGLEEKDFVGKTNWIFNHLDKDNLNAWKAWIKKQDSALVLKFKNKQHNFFVRTLSFLKEEKKIKVKFTELNAAEKIKFLQDHSKLPRQIDLFIIHQKYFEGAPTDRWLKVEEILAKRNEITTKIPLLILSAKKLSDGEKLEMAGFSSDIAFKPLDRLAFNQKVHLLCPELKLIDAIALRTVLRPQTIKSANPVKIEEISEAGLVMAYNRALETGSFRQFVLWAPLEASAPELVANCNFVEEIEKENFKIHFVFFAVTDHSLKRVRLWIMDNYIQSKEKG